MRISDWSSDVCSSDLFGKILAAGSGKLAERSDTIAMPGEKVAPRADRGGAVIEGIDGRREHHFRADGVKREFEAERGPEMAAPALCRPGEVGVFTVTGPDKPTPCRDHPCPQPR